MSNLWILACKEAGNNNTEGSGYIYVTRLPVAVSNAQPGIPDGFPDNWYFVGPGNNPSVQEYNGTQFILTFNYLSHLNCRIIDIATWPSPTEVVPISSPPTITIGSNTTGSGAPQDSLALKTEGGTSFGLIQEFFNPPILQQPLLFFDSITNTYSVTIQPVATYFPQPPALIVTPAVSNTQVFYRFYVRPYPYTGPWVLTTDWTLENYVFNVPTQPLFSFAFSNVGSLRYQFSVTWGGQFSPTDQWNPNAHMEGIPGQIYITVDSMTQHSNVQAFIDESLTLDRTSTETFTYFGNRQQFIVFSSLTSFSTTGDSIGFSKSLVEGGSTFTAFGSRDGFVQIPQNETTDSLLFSQSYRQGNTLQAVMG